MIRDPQRDLVASSGAGQAPLVSTLADDPDMAELVQVFVQELPQRIAAIQEALAEEDLERLTSLAHQLKGAAGGYGFSPITEIARLIEHQARDRMAGEMLRQTVDELADLCRRASAC